MDALPLIFLPPVAFWCKDMYLMSAMPQLLLKHQAGCRHPVNFRIKRISIYANSQILFLYPSSYSLHHCTAAFLTVCHCLHLQSLDTLLQAAIIAYLPACRKVSFPSIISTDFRILTVNFFHFSPHFWPFSLKI